MSLAPPADQTARRQRFAFALQAVTLDFLRQFGKLRQRFIVPAAVQFFLVARDQCFSNWTFDFVGGQIIISALLNRGIHLGLQLRSFAPTLF
jgi:hypothetical protein